MALKKKKRLQTTGQNESEFIDMGKFYFMNNKYDKAIEEFKKALEINPGNAEIYYNLGLIYEAKNEISTAKQMYEKALAIEPEYTIARQHLNKIVGL